MWNENSWYIILSLSLNNCKSRDIFSYRDHKSNINIVLITNFRSFIIYTSVLYYLGDLRFVFVLRNFKYQDKKSFSHSRECWLWQPNGKLSSLCIFITSVVCQCLGNPSSLLAERNSKHSTFPQLLIADYEIFMVVFTSNPINPQEMRKKEKQKQSRTFSSSHSLLLLPLSRIERSCETLCIFIHAHRHFYGRRVRHREIPFLTLTVFSLLSSSFFPFWHGKVSSYLQNMWADFSSLVNFRYCCRPTRGGRFERALLVFSFSRISSWNSEPFFALRWL